MNFMFGKNEAIDSVDKNLEGSPLIKNLIEQTNYDIGQPGRIIALDSKNLFIYTGEEWQRIRAFEAVSLLYYNYEDKEFSRDDYENLESENK